MKHADQPRLQQQQAGVETRPPDRESLPRKSARRKRSSSVVSTINDRLMPSMPNRKSNCNWRLIRRIRRLVAIRKPMVRHAKARLRPATAAPHPPATARTGSPARATRPALRSVAQQCKAAEPLRAKTSAGRPAARAPRPAARNNVVKSNPVIATLKRQHPHRKHHTHQQSEPHDQRVRRHQPVVHPQRHAAQQLAAPAPRPSTIGSITFRSNQFDSHANPRSGATMIAV